MRLMVVLVGLAMLFSAQGFAMADADAEQGKKDGEVKKGDGERGKRGGRGGEGKRGGRRGELREKFDVDGDGKLSEEERAELRKFLEERRKERGGEGREGRGGGRGRGGRGGGDRPSREEIVKKFDLDGDGKLNEEERAAAKKHMDEQRGKRGKDARPSREEILGKFDADGDGKLNEAERAAAKKYMDELRAKRGQGRRGGGGDRGDRPNREELRAKFDANGDGTLDKDEMAALKAHLKKMRESKGRGDKPKKKPEGETDK